MKTPPRKTRPGDQGAPDVPAQNEAPTQPSEPKPEFVLPLGVPYLRWSDAAMLVRIHDAPPDGDSRLRVDYVLRED